MSQSKELTQTQPIKELTQTQPVAYNPPPALADPAVLGVLRSLTDVSAPFELRRDRREVIIGRHPDCDLVVRDARVSGRHVRIFLDEAERLYVQELSQNYCWLNDTCMEQNDTRALHHGDTLSLCNRATATSAENARLRTFAAWLFRSSASASGKAGLVAAEEPDEQGRVSQAWVDARWDLRTELGSGNFSEVRLGLDVKHGRTYAVKIVDASRFEQKVVHRMESARLTLRSEAELLLRLRHPNIVHVHEIFETHERLYIVMERLCCDLLCCLLEGPLTEARARTLFAQVCDAVRFLHDRSVIHRDIKPENVLVTTREREHMTVKLADFGLARLSHGSVDCKTYCGTPAYFAPEVISSVGDRTKGYDKPADMWSLGVLLYVMLSNAPPFEEDNLLADIIRGKYEFDVEGWQSVSTEAKSLVSGLMTVNPKTRLSIAQAIDYLQRRWLVASLEPRTPQRRSSRQSELEAPAEASVPKRRRSSELGLV